MPWLGNPQYPRKKRVPSVKFEKCINTDGRSCEPLSVKCSSCQTNIRRATKRRQFAK